MEENEDGTVSQSYQLIPRVEDDKKALTCGYQLGDQVLTEVTLYISQ
jgi:hypothetical protein